MQDDGSPFPLVEMWNGGNKKVRAVLAQAYSYMASGGVSYGIVTCYHATWALCRACCTPAPPPPHQHQPPPAAIGRGSGGRTTRAAAAAAAAIAGAHMAVADGDADGGSRGGDTLYVAGPFLATTAHTAQQPAVTAAAAIMYTMLLSLGVVSPPAASGAPAERSRRGRGSGSDSAAPHSSGSGSGGGGRGRGGGEQGGRRLGDVGPAVGQAAAGSAATDAFSRRSAGTSEAGPAGADKVVEHPLLLLQGHEGAAGRLLAPATAAEATAAEATAAEATAAVALREHPPPPLRVVAGPVLGEGYAGIITSGRVGERDAILKFLGPNAEGIEAYHTECAAYAALAPMQGQVLPQLLAAGLVRSLFPVRTDPHCDPPPPPDDVCFIATNRVPGLTLRELLTRRGSIEPAVARAAVRALQRLHAAEIPPGAAVGACAGGGGSSNRRSGGRFLHGDVRLSNFMLLLPPAVRLPPPAAPDDASTVAAGGAQHGAAAGALCTSHGGGSGCGGEWVLQQQAAVAAGGMAANVTLDPDYPALSGGAPAAHSSRQQERDEAAVALGDRANELSEPCCVVIDLGLSRLDGSEAEQRAELRELEDLLSRVAAATAAPKSQLEGSA